MRLLFALAAAAVLAGCSDIGAQRSAELDPPSNPGNIEDLHNTAWEASGKNTLYFYPDGRAGIRAARNIATDAAPQDIPINPGSYSYEDGVLELSFDGLPPLFGTWDGARVRVQDPRFEIHNYEHAGEAPPLNGAGAR